MYRSLKFKLLHLSREKRGQIGILTTFLTVWVLLLQGLFKFHGVDWYLQIIFCRFLLIFLAILFSILILFFDLPNIISVYCLICMLCQSFLSIFEGPKTIEFYQYTPYFVLVSTLSLNGRLISWLRYAGPLIAISMIFPLFFKDPSYFKSVGMFTYTFTTPIAVLFLSFIVARISAGKFEALTLNLSLQKQLFELESKSKAEISVQLEAAKEKIARDATQLALTQVAQQVVHDIRSPVAALNSIIRTVGNVDSEVQAQIKAVVTRIQDIANNLLKKQPSQLADVLSDHSKGSVAPECVFHLIETVIDEKTLQINSLKEIRFEVEIDPKAKTARSLLDKTEFCNLFSNLLNNSIDAISSAGFVSVKLDRKESTLTLAIVDNGKGIPAEILSKLGSRGYSHDKVNGNGFGLYHAISNLRLWGGDLQIQSTVGTGTSVKCTLKCYG